MKNYSITNKIKVNKLISEKNIVSYSNRVINEINNENLELNNNIMYNIYTTGQIYIDDDISIKFDNKKTKYVIEDLLIDGNLYISNNDKIDVIDAIAYSTIPDYIFRYKKINNIKNKINEKRKRF